MEYIKVVVDRQVGNGFKIPKFHQIIHALKNIHRCGSMRNSDGGPEECQGKKNSKEPTRLTQMRSNSVCEKFGEIIA